MKSETIYIAAGQHDPLDSCDDPERCFYEWYNWLSHSIHTDDCPPDVSSVLYQFGIYLNDILPDNQRQQLARFLPGPNTPSPLSGTSTDGKDEARWIFALNWLVHTMAPTWLELAGLLDEAQQLRKLQYMKDLLSIQSVWPMFQQICIRVEDTAKSVEFYDDIDIIIPTMNIAIRAAKKSAEPATSTIAAITPGDKLRIIKTTTVNIEQIAWGAVNIATRAAILFGDKVITESSNSDCSAVATTLLQPTVTRLHSSAIELFERMIDPVALQT